MNDLKFQTEIGVPTPFGASAQKGGINFAVYAEKPEKLSLCFFHESDLTNPIQEFELDPNQNRTGNVWHILVKNLPSDTVYAYKITINEQTYLLLDPYAKAIASDAKWHEEISQEYTYKPIGKIFPGSSFDWEGDRPLNIPKNELIIYEMHVRGFTIHPSSQVAHPGTFRGIIEKIPYLVELGINAVELMPIQEFNENEAIQVNPQTQKRLHNYFGYSTVNFFSPMNRFSSASAGDQTIQECKTMIKELHKNGIEVILDVVFNHTAEGNEKGPKLSFKGFDAKTYYMINDQGQYLNFSGCGNTINCNHPIVIQFIIDALRYWVTEMHVDGFRFDLASIFTRDENGTPLDNPPLVNAITKDPVLAQAKLIAEAWDAGGLYQLGNFASRGNRWSEWNGKYRDCVRNFIKGSPDQKKCFSGFLSGSHHIYPTSSPSSSVNFITAHDGFTLADLVAYNEKHNEANGEENKDGISNNDSWNCGAEGTTNSKKVIGLRQRQMRNFFLALMVSQGIPMILMGDEYAHTRNGNNNAWSQDNELNWFLWDKLNEKSGFYHFYRNLIQIRKNHPLFKRDTFFGEKEVTWHGVEPFHPDWDNDNRFVAFTLNNPEGDPQFYIAFNASHNVMEVELPPAGDNKEWCWVVNTHKPSPQDFCKQDKKKPVEEDPLPIFSYSSIMLVKQDR